MADSSKEPTEDGPGTFFDLLRLPKSDPKEENASSFSDEAEEFEKSLLPQVVGLAAGEGQCPSPECDSILRHGGFSKSRQEKTAKNPDGFLVSGMLMNASEPPGSIATAGSSQGSDP